MANNNIPRPRVACEVSVERVVAARAADKRLRWSRPPRRLCPRVRWCRACSRPIWLRARRWSSALRDALSTVAGRSRDVVLVIPDATTRIMLLDFDTLPDKLEDAEGGSAIPPEEVAAVRHRSVGRIVRSPGCRQRLRVIAAVTPRSGHGRV